MNTLEITYRNRTTTLKGKRADDWMAKNCPDAWGRVGSLPRGVISILYTSPTTGMSGFIRRVYTK